MKTLTSLKVNGIYQDVIIKHSSKIQIDEETKETIYVNEKEKIVKTKGNIDNIFVYVKDENNSNKVKLIDIYSDSFKLLYKKILEIESIESEEHINRTY